MISYHGGPRPSAIWLLLPPPLILSSLERREGCGMDRGMYSPPRPPSSALELSQRSGFWPGIRSRFSSRLITETEPGSELLILSTYVHREREAKIPRWGGVHNGCIKVASGKRRQLLKISALKRSSCISPLLLTLLQLPSPQRLKISIRAPESAIVALYYRPRCTDQMIWLALCCLHRAHERRAKAELRLNYACFVLGSLATGRISETPT